jgi:hypothetical protein
MSKSERAYALLKDVMIFVNRVLLFALQSRVELYKLQWS